MSPGSSPPRRILFCTDFSENAEFSFDFAIDVAVRSPNSILFLLHVLAEPDAQFWKTYIYESDEDVDAKAREHLDAKIEKEYLAKLPEGLSCKVEFRIGRDYMKILEFVEENEIDQIIIGRQGHSSIETVLFGNVTEKIVRKAPCPVLVVPMDYKEISEKRNKENK
jgi:nucleotide-binding universal stress UspA family protein